MLNGFKIFAFLRGHFKLKCSSDIVLALMVEVVVKGLHRLTVSTFGGKSLRYLVEGSTKKKRVLFYIVDGLEIGSVS